MSIIHLRFRKKEIVQYFLNAFYMKTRLSQDLIPDLYKTIKEKVFYNTRYEKCKQREKCFFVKIIRKIE